MSTRLLSFDPIKYLVCFATLYAAAAPALAVDLFTENFEGITLQPVVTFESELRERNAWQTVGNDGPTGFTEINNTTSLGDNESGVMEFEGWRFVNKEWWINTAGDQNRSQFLNGSGIVAVADPDEWDDFGNPDQGSEGDLLPENGVFDSTLVTPAISLSSVNANDTLTLSFSSSWRDEDQQTATLTAVYDVGDPVEIHRWTSDSADITFKDDAENEQLAYEIDNIPAGASSVQFEFRLQGNNDWWWAIDNLRATTDSLGGDDGVLRAIIDRGTGEVKIVNNTGETVDLRGYSLRSTDGVFDEANASFLADTDSDWITATDVGGDINDLSELHLSSSGFDAGEEINFGNVWQQYFIEDEDLTFNYLVEGSDDQFEGIIEFTGGAGESYDPLDLNFDNVVDRLDWVTFRDNYGSGLDGLTQAVRYGLSDLDSDGLHTLLDFTSFQRQFDIANGPGAFTAMVAGVPEPASALLFAPLLIGLAAIRRHAATALAVMLVFGLAMTDRSEAQLVLLEEDFEGVVLEDPIEENGAQGTGVVTRTGPAGWVTDNSGIPGLGDPATDGVVDWAGWAFADKEWWIDAAGDQDRSQFTRGQGTILVSDNDEWDDDANLVGSTGNLYDTLITTPTISIPAGVPAGRIKLSFDTSWRDEADGGGEDSNQTATIDVRYDNGAGIEVFRWESDPESDFFQDDTTDARIQLDLQYDGIASSLELDFLQSESDNDWWWAIDNLLVEVPTDPAKIRVNTFNGQVFLEGDDTISSAISAINIASPSGLLEMVTQGGLADSITDTVGGGDEPGEQWELLASTAIVYAEAFLDGSSEFDINRSELLGTLLNGAMLDDDPLVAAAASDLEFTYSLATGTIVDGVVEFFYEEVAGLPGDFNSDGVVDLADFTVWRDNLGAADESVIGGNGNGIGGVDVNDWLVWRNNFSTVSSASAGTSSVPEPATWLVSLVGLAIFGSIRRARVAGIAVVTLAVLGTIGSQADAQLPPSPFVDRDYGFGDADSGAVVGQPVTQTDGNGALVTFDDAGATGQNQLIDLLVVTGTSTVPSYVDTSDRPDGGGGIGLFLNPGLPFNESLIQRQYLRTGFAEALNFPEQSPSSITSLVDLGSSDPKTLNYFRINDRGFDLWAKPTNITGEQHIVMDSQQHGVLIDADGNFAMRYASEFEVTFDQQPGLDGEIGTEDDILVTSDPIITPNDVATGVTAQEDTWYHLSVVRAAGPSNGSVFYINGKAEAIAFGEYATETIVNVGEGDVFTNIGELDTSPLTVGRATVDPRDGATSFDLPVSESFFFQGVVDDLEMFVIGLNDNDNLLDGGTNVLNDYGEYLVQRDNDYVAAFAPIVDGDLTGDDLVTIADAAAFADNWLFENFLTGINPASGVESTLLVGDLFTRNKGDFNYDGVVNLEDWAVLNNANPTAGAAALRMIASVPEPMSGLLLAWLGVTACSWRHRQSA